MVGLNCSYECFLSGRLLYSIFLIVMPFFNYYLSCDQSLNGNSKKNYILLILWYSKILQFSHLEPKGTILVDAPLTSRPLRFCNSNFIPKHCEHFRIETDKTDIPRSDLVSTDVSVKLKFYMWNPGFIMVYEYSAINLNDSRFYSFCQPGHKIW